MQHPLRSLRIACTIVVVSLLLLLVLFNLRLYPDGRYAMADAQLRFLESELDQGGAERMQALFPEGFVVTWTLYGLAAAQVAESLPVDDARRADLLAAARQAVAAVSSGQAKASFVAEMRPAYGAFYASWSLYLRSVLLRAAGVDAPPPFDLAVYEADCQAFAAALAGSTNPFLQTYPGLAWPADTAVGVAALAIHDQLLPPRYTAVTKAWLAAAQARLDAEYGALTHAASSVKGTPMGLPRGASLALMTAVLGDVDAGFAQRQYQILRTQFADTLWGLPGLREYPRGVNGPADIDSGPIVFGFSGPATVVGAGAALGNGDTAYAEALLAVTEAFGFAVEFAGSRRYIGGALPVGDAFLAWARSTPSKPQPNGNALGISAAWRWRCHALSLGVALLLGGLGFALNRRDVAGM